MGKNTKETILRMVEEDDVEFIRLQFTDMFGIMKNIAVTSGQLEKALDNRCMFDGSAMKGAMRTAESDMYLHPDFDTFTTFPWRPQQGKVARLICDVCDAAHTPYEGDPRFILKKVLAQAQEMGYTFQVGPECEFFLFHTDDDGLPTTTTHEKAGYFDIGPVDLGENARRDMVLTLEEMGYTVEASYHEAAPAQHEIDFKYDEALRSADDFMTFKLAVKTIAKRHGLHATFMPKPCFGQNGSGFHVNMSLLKDGKNAFFDASDPDGLSQTAYCFIGGLLRHMKGISAIANPLVNSYKRLVPGYEAPIYLTWSAKNKNPLIRVPASRGEETRIELRSPDPSANPYLTMALCLAAGLQGIREQILPPDAVDKDINRMSRAEQKAEGIECLPATLREAIKELERDEFLQEVLGDAFIQTYRSAKKEEWMQYTTQVTPWEIEQYLYRI